MKIRVNKQLSVPYSGTENPSTNKTIKLQSKCANGNVFVIENASEISRIQTSKDIGSTSTAHTSNDTIKEVYLADTLSAISTYCFRSCSNLSSISLPAGLKKIGVGAFIDCGKLSSIEFPEGLTNIESNGSSGNPTFGNAALTSITLPESITTLGADAFYHTTNVEFISAMNSCDITEFVFASYTSTSITSDTLKNIYLKNQNIIGNCAFGSHKYVHVPPTVEEGEDPVEEDPSLSALQIYYFDHLTDEQKKAQKNEAKDNDGNWLSNYQIPTIYGANTYSVFQNYDIHVPTALYDKWIAADKWNTISSHIHPYSEVTYVDGTMEMELDPSKTYIVADNNIAAVSFTATPTQHVEYEEQEVTDPETGEPSTVQVEKMVNDTVSATAYDIANSED